MSPVLARFEAVALARGRPEWHRRRAGLVVVADDELATYGDCAEHLHIDVEAGENAAADGRG